MDRHVTLAGIAIDMGLTPVEVIALPTVISVAASKIRWDEARFIAEVQKNPRLRDYLADACRIAVKEAA